MLEEQQIWLHIDASHNDEEVVERKGVGHPDTLADGIAELSSISYSAYCLREFGAILHHNLDKVGVFGGLARFDWTHGEHVRPLRIVFGGRASMRFGTAHVPVQDILEAAAKEYLQYALPGLRHAPVEFIHLTSDSSKFDRWFSPNSLGDLPEYRNAKCNDTAYVVGSAPFTTAERIAFEVEALLREYTWAGSDIKVLVVRHKDKYRVTVCVPALVGHFQSAADYMDTLNHTEEAVRTHIMTAHFLDDLNLAINAHARLANSDPASAGYVTLSGSAIDYGEDGLVGRGNARTGLIQPNRRHGNETLFGKNPTYHVGKVYGYFVDSIAARISRAGTDCECTMSTRNGAPLNRPETCSVTVAMPIDSDFIRRIINETLESHDFGLRLVSERLYVPRVWQKEAPHWTELQYQPDTLPER